MNAMKETKTDKGLIKKFVDGWKNVFTGIGIGRKDKLISSFVTHDILKQRDVEELFAGDDIAEKVVDRIPFEATREWIELTKIEDPKVELWLADRMSEVDAKVAFKKASSDARLYGGSIIVMIHAGVTDLSQPMDCSKEGPMVNLVVLNRWEIDITTQQIDKNIFSDNFGMPEFYNLNTNVRSRSTNNNKTNKIHHSRTLRFDGAALPKEKFINNQYWHDSVLSRMLTMLQLFSSSYDSVGRVLQDFRLGILKMKGLADLIASNADGEKIIQQRLQAFDLGKSTIKTGVIDETETYDQTTPNLSGVDAIMTKIDNRLVAATDMPHTIILGQSPSGMDATGSVVIRNFYDKIASWQEIHFRKNLNKLIKCLFLDKKSITKGEEPETWDFDFKPLWQMTDKENAEIKKVISEADGNYIDRGVLSPEEVAISRFGGEEFSMETVINKEARETPNTIDIDDVELEGIKEDLDATRLLKIDMKEILKDIEIKNDLLEEKENEIRFRVEEPELFQVKSFRRIAFDKARGIFAIIGKLKGKTKTTLQALRFLKEKDWTMAKVRTWLKEHKGEF